MRCADSHGKATLPARLTPPTPRPLPKLPLPTTQWPSPSRKTHAYATPQVYDVDDVDKIQGPPSGKEILEQIDINGDNEVTIDEFSDLMESHMYATRREYWVPRTHAPYPHLLCPAALHKRANATWPRTPHRNTSPPHTHQVYTCPGVRPPARPSAAPTRGQVLGEGNRGPEDHVRRL